MSRLNKLVQESVRPASARRLQLDESLLDMLWQLKCGIDQVELSRSRGKADEVIDAEHHVEEPSSN